MLEAREEQMVAERSRKAGTLNRVLLVSVGLAVAGFLVPASNRAALGVLLGFGSDEEATAEASPGPDGDPPQDLIEVLRLDEGLSAGDVHFAAQLLDYVQPPSPEKKDGAGNPAGE